ncbi:energy coupling factor transporter S component ThiW [Domibacillus enclensis]|uniref:Energy coupling factor transporter S component ThiW n=1 Tax=Domibacillus enclensis TaxID=1017273 RepID=A0A1N6TWI0_9BACI|nr:energy coupling factor transporter S component ThiW [Domibacillus enclensis]OXS78373.1 energy coupling factor transporter S component ThiW [Domibacillus enclensis]SIQ57723.1 energy coupling factor transporter S component ThiW [Domibacillus enclensis]
MFTPKKMAVMALFAAIGVLGATFIWFPAGAAKAFPVQHAINVMAAILLGPGPAVVIAFLIAAVRNLLGIGTILAFPGSMIGALLAGYVYKKWKSPSAAALGEMIGTGVIASLVSVPVANLFLGMNAAALAFMPAFLISSITGAILGLLLAVRIAKTRAVKSI